MSDHRTDGEQLWDRICDAAPVSPHFALRMFTPCTVKRYDGMVLAIVAPSAVHAEFLREHCTVALKEARDQVQPGLKLVVTAKAEA